MDVMEGIRGLSGIKFWLRMGWAIFSWTHFGSSLRGLLLIFLEEAKVTTDGVGFPTSTATARRPGALSSMVSQRKSLQILERIHYYPGLCASLSALFLRSTGQIDFTLTYKSLTSSEL